MTLTSKVSSWVCFKPCTIFSLKKNKHRTYLVGIIRVDSSRWETFGANSQQHRNDMKWHHHTSFTSGVADSLSSSSPMLPLYHATALPALCSIHPFTIVCQLSSSCWWCYNVAHKTTLLILDPFSWSTSKGRAKFRPWRNFCMNLFRHVIRFHQKKSGRKII